MSKQEINKYDSQLSYVDKLKAELAVVRDSKNRHIVLWSESLEKNKELKAENEFLKLNAKRTCTCGFPLQEKVDLLDRIEQFQAENVQLREYVEWVAKCSDTIPLMQHKGYVKNIITNAKSVLKAVRKYKEEV